MRVGGRARYLSHLDAVEFPLEEALEFPDLVVVGLELALLPLLHLHLRVDPLLPLHAVVRLDDHDLAHIVEVVLHLVDDLLLLPLQLSLLLLEQVHLLQEVQPLVLIVPQLGRVAAAGLGLGRRHFGLERPSTMHNNSEDLSVSVQSNTPISSRSVCFGLGVGMLSCE